MNFDLLWTHSKLQFPLFRLIMSRAFFKTAIHLQHIAIIMDGNGRWAKSKGFSRSKGHIEGAKTLLRLFPFFADTKISHVTAFAFSQENWKRSNEEIQGIFALVKQMITDNFFLFEKHQIKFRWLGEEKGVPVDIVEIIRWLEKKTSSFKKLNFNFAFNYSGQSDILNGIEKLRASKKKLTDPKEFRNYLSTYGQPDVDMLIRTGGEKRISNFLLWQIAYAELYFTKTLWPSITSEEINQMIQDFHLRDRRFGSAPSNNQIEKEVLNA
jgi:undecaprenyl diphosphate synthase